MNAIFSAIGTYVVAISAASMVTLGVVALVAPEKFRVFMLAFAGSLRLHLLEIFIRVIVGAGFLVTSPTITYRELFVLVGWILIATSLVMLVVPWTLHRRFARWAVPRALQFTPVLGISALLSGTFLAYALAMA